MMGVLTMSVEVSAFSPSICCFLPLRRREQRFSQGQLICVFFSQTEYNNREQLKENTSTSISITTSRFVCCFLVKHMVCLSAWNLCATEGKNTRFFLCKVGLACQLGCPNLGARLQKNTRIFCGRNLCVFFPENTCVLVGFKTHGYRVDRL